MVAVRRLALWCGSWKVLLWLKLLLFWLRLRLLLLSQRPLFQIIVMATIVLLRLLEFLPVLRRFAPVQQVPSGPLLAGLHAVLQPLTPGRLVSAVGSCAADVVRK